MTTISEYDYLKLFLQAQVAASVPVKEIGNRFGTIPNDVKIKPLDLDFALEDRTQAINYHLSKGDKVSDLLLEQLLEIEQYGFVTIDDIRYPCHLRPLYWTMESISKGEHSHLRPFYNSPLKGQNLFHVHHDFFNGMGHNIENHFKRKYGRNKKGFNRFKADVISLIKELHKDPTEISIGELLSPLFAGIINEVCVSPKLTGEWLIFQKSKNYVNFLCLALHEEGDEKIYQKIKPYLEITE